MKPKWSVKKLGEIADFLDSQRKPVTEVDRIPGPYPYYGANGKQDSVRDYIFDDELVLLAEDGGNFGSKTRPIAYRVSGKCWVNNHAHVLKNKEGVSDIDFLGYSLMYYDVTPYISGTTRAKLNKTEAQRIPLNVPEVNIQQKIVERLDAIRKAQEINDLQISKTEELFKSVLNQELNKLSQLRKKPLLEFCEKITDGVHNTPPLVNEGIPMLDSVDIQDMQINSENPRKFISKETDMELARRCKPQKNDVLISSRGTIGKIAIVGDQNFNIMGNIILIRPKLGELNTVYLANYLIVNREKVLRLSRATSQSGLYLTDVRNLEVEIPSNEEQEKIVEKLSEVQEHKKLLLKQKTLYKELFDSVLDKSMKGEMDD